VRVERSWATESVRRVYAGMKCSEVGGRVMKVKSGRGGASAGVVMVELSWPFFRRWWW